MVLWRQHCGLSIGIMVEIHLAAAVPPDIYIDPILFQPQLTNQDCAVACGVGRASRARRRHALDFNSFGRPWLGRPTFWTSYGSSGNRRFGSGRLNWDWTACRHEAVAMLFLFARRRAIRFDRESPLQLYAKVDALRPVIGFVQNEGRQGWPHERRLGRWQRAR